KLRLLSGHAGLRRPQGLRRWCKPVEQLLPRTMCRTLLSDFPKVEKEKAMSAIGDAKTMDVRKETDSLGEVDVPTGKLWGAQTQRSLEHFSIGQDLMPREMIAAYATLKKAAANANHAAGLLDEKRHKLIDQ